MIEWIIVVAVMAIVIGLMIRDEREQMKDLAEIHANLDRIEELIDELEKK